MFRSGHLKTICPLRLSGAAMFSRADGKNLGITSLAGVDVLLQPLSTRTAVIKPRDAPATALGRDRVVTGPCRTGRPLPLRLAGVRASRPTLLRSPPLPPTSFLTGGHTPRSRWPPTPSRPPEWHRLASTRSAEI